MGGSDTGGCPCRGSGRRRKGGDRKRGLQKTLEQEVEGETEALIGRAAAQAAFDLEALETGLRAQALRVAARVLERQLNADRSDHVGPVCACPQCGADARYAGRRRKRFVTVLGPIDLQRAYYACGRCQAGFCPRDRALGLVDSSLSPAVLRMVGTVGAMVSFEEGSALLRDLAGVRVDAKQVERSAERLGAEIAQDERHRVEAPVPAEIAPTLYCGVDGTGIPMRAEALAGRPGKQPDGSAKTREVKLCAVFSAEGRDAEGTPVRDAGSVSYSAAIEIGRAHV